MSAVDHVVLVDQDCDEIPARHVLRLHGHEAVEHMEAGVSIEFCEADECTESASYNIVQTFYVPVSELRAALALVLGEA